MTLSFFLDGRAPKKAHLTMPVDVCYRTYTLHQSVECLTDSREQSIKLTEPLQCLAYTGYTVAAGLILVALPVTFFFLFITLQVLQAAYRLFARKHRGRVFLLPPSESGVVRKDQRVQVNLKEGVNNELLDSALRYAIVDYVARTSAAKSVDVDRLYQWNHNSPFSFSSLSLSFASLALWVGWMCMEVIILSEVSNTLLCIGDSWNGQIIPVVVSILASYLSWFLFLAGLGGLLLSFYRNYRSRRYLAVFNEHLVYFKMSILFGDVEFVDSLRVKGVENPDFLIIRDLSFSPTLKMACLCRWHPFLTIQGEDDEGFIRDLRICAFNDQAEAIMQWLSSFSQSKMEVIQEDL